MLNHCMEGWAKEGEGGREGGRRVQFDNKVCLLTGGGSALQLWPLAEQDQAEYKISDWTGAGTGLGWASKQIIN